MTDAQRELLDAAQTTVAYLNDHRSLLELACKTRLRAAIAAMEAEATGSVISSHLDSLLEGGNPLDDEQAAGGREPEEQA